MANELIITYATPVGTFATWEEAAARCEKADLDPCTCIEVLKGSAAGPGAVCWEFQANREPIRLSFSIKCF